MQNNKWEVVDHSAKIQTTEYTLWVTINQKWTPHKIYHRTKITQTLVDVKHHPIPWCLKWSSDNYHDCMINEWSKAFRTRLHILVVDSSENQSHHPCPWADVRFTLLAVPGSLKTFTRTRPWPEYKLLRSEDDLVSFQRSNRSRHEVVRKLT